MGAGNRDDAFDNNFNSHFGAVTFLLISAMFGPAEAAMLAFPFERPMFMREYATGTCKLQQATLLCRATLHYDILCCAALYYSMLYCAVIYYFILCYTTLCHAVLYYTTLNYAILYYATLYYVILCYTMLHHVMLYYAVLCYDKT